MIGLWKAELMLLNGGPDLFWPRGEGPGFAEVWDRVKPWLRSDGAFGYDPEREGLYRTALLALWSGYRRDGHHLGRLVAMMRLLLPASDFLSPETLAHKRRIIADAEAARDALTEWSGMQTQPGTKPDRDHLAAFNFLRLHGALAPEIPFCLGADSRRCDEGEWLCLLHLLAGCSAEPTPQEKWTRSTGLERDAMACGMDEAFVRQVRCHEQALARARWQRDCFGTRICGEPEAWTLEKAGPEAARLWRQVDEAENELIRDYCVFRAAWNAGAEDTEAYLHLTEQSPCDKLKKS